MKLERVMLIAAMILISYANTMVVVIQLWALAFLGIVVLGLVAKKGYAKFSAYGTARWADADDLKYAGMLDSRDGLILGKIEVRPPKLAAINGLFYPSVNSFDACRNFMDAFRGHKALIRLANAVHTAVIAPTGVGKGVSCVVPFLLACEDSCVVVDFKGENARLTAQRRRQMGHRVVILDPFAVVGGTDTLNPLDFIDAANPLAIDDCRDLAQALVVRTGEEKEPHWLDAAESWIAAMIAAVVQYGEPGNRSLQTVRTLLSNPEKMEAVIKLMCGSDAWQGMLARMGNQLTQFKDKELGSTLTTTNRFMRFLDTLAILENTTASTFDPAELTGGSKQTIYLVLPPEHMRAQSALLRMWIGAMLRAVVRGGLQQGNKVHFVLDEAASLGHMEALDDAVDKYRGYGVRLQFYYQSVGQLKKCWPGGQDQTLLSNTSQVYFGVNDNETAKYISERLGKETIVVTEGSKNKGMSKSYSDDGKNSISLSGGTSESWKQHGRELLMPDEVMALSPRTAITFTPGIPPLWSTLTRYYERSFEQKKGGRLRVLVTAAVLLAVATAAAWGLTAFVQKESQQPFSNVQWAR